MMGKYMKKVITHNYKHHAARALALAVMVLLCGPAFSQTTAVPFVNIGPDSRGAGMGDVGSATTPDAYATFWNPAKLAMLDSRFGGTIGYNPWLRNTVPDIALSNVSAYYRPDIRQAFGLSLTYFNYGNIDFVDPSGNFELSYKPSEVAVALSYGYKLSEKLAASVSLRYINSRLASGLSSNGAEAFNSGSAVTGDLSLFYQNNNIRFGGKAAIFGLGLNLSNMGSKISYSEGYSDFCPANVRLGTSLRIFVADQHSVTLAADINKLMVPSLDSIARSTTFLSGLFSSFSDSPDGFKGELDELKICTGAEYWYRRADGVDVFSVRAGYVRQNARRGLPSYATAGMGFRYMFMGLDLSYLMAIERIHPLAETVRISASFRMGELKNVRPAVLK